MTSWGNPMTSRRKHADLPESHDNAVKSPDDVRRDHANVARGEVSIRTGPEMLRAEHLIFVSDPLGVHSTRKYAYSVVRISVL
jgi:hypothetical protein